MDNSNEQKDVQFFDEEPEMKQVKGGLCSKTGGISYSVLVIIYVLFSIVVTAVTAIIAYSIQGKYGYTFTEAVNYILQTDAYTYVSYLLAPIIICLCVLLVSWRCKIGYSQIFPVKCKPKYFLIAVMLIFGLLFSLSNLNGLFVKFFRLFGYNPKSSYFPDLSGWKVVPAFIVIAILPAVFEEIMFRGLLLNCNENGMGSVRAIFVTGFCFSLFHASPEQTVYQFIAGCAFAFIAVRSGSLLPSILMHFINNALIVILAAFGLFDEAGNLIMPQIAFIIVTVISALSFVGAVVWLALDKTKIKKGEKGGVRDFFLYGSVAIFALGFIWILSLFGVS